MTADAKGDRPVTCIASISGRTLASYKLSPQLLRLHCTENKWEEANAQSKMKWSFLVP